MLGSEGDEVTAFLADDSLTLIFFSHSTTVYQTEQVL